MTSFCMSIRHYMPAIGSTTQRHIYIIVVCSEVPLAFVNIKNTSKHTVVSKSHRNLPGRWMWDSLLPTDYALRPVVGHGLYLQQSAGCSCCKNDLYVWTLDWWIWHKFIWFPCSSDRKIIFYLFLFVVSALWDVRIYTLSRRILWLFTMKWYYSTSRYLFICSFVSLNEFRKKYLKCSNTSRQLIDLHVLSQNSPVKLLPQTQTAWWVLLTERQLPPFSHVTLAQPGLISVGRKWMAQTKTTLLTVLVNRTGVSLSS